MPKVWNKRDKNAPKDAVYVGRPSKWGNPYQMGKPHPVGEGNGRNEPMTRERVIYWYKFHLEEEAPHLIKDAKRELKGKDLVCWCAPAACHADVLLEIANAE